MNSYQILYPYAMTIDADTFATAAKNYVKTHRDMNIAHLIMSDQFNHMRKANLNYYTKDGRNKVGISIFPYTQPILGYSSSDPNARYPPVPYLLGAVPSINIDGRGL